MLSAGNHLTQCLEWHVFVRKWRTEHWIYKKCLAHCCSGCPDSLAVKEESVLASSVNHMGGRILCARALQEVSTSPFAWERVVQVGNVELDWWKAMELVAKALIVSFQRLVWQQMDHGLSLDEWPDRNGTGTGDQVQYWQWRRGVMSMQKFHQEIGGTSW